MNVDNFKLSKVFHDNAKEYVTKPVIAAKYQPGMESGFLVHYSNVGIKGKEAIIHEGIRFFSSIDEAWAFINANEKQYAKENDVIVEMEVIYDKPEPVLHRLVKDAMNQSGIHFQFGEQSFISDESSKYEFFILENNFGRNCWIVQEMNGNIRVWYNELEGETFFGKGNDIVYEKMKNGDYIKVAV
jgi:hypothetical protein